MARMSQMISRAIWKYRIGPVAWVTVGRKRVCEGRGSLCRKYSKKGREEPFILAGCVEEYRGF